MNIHTVITKLKNTIAGKERLLEGTKRQIPAVVELGRLRALQTTVEFLEINIDELKRILQDVEKCCKKATADSWALNPDRSGGAFTDEEINRSNEWH